MYSESSHHGIGPDGPWPTAPQGQVSGPIHTRNRKECSYILTSVASLNPLPGRTLTPAWGRGAPAASMVETSSCVGKECAFTGRGGSSHQGSSSPRLAQHLAAHPHSLHPRQPSPSTSCYNRAPDTCCPRTAHSDKYHLWGDDRTVVTLHLGEGAVRCGEGIQLCRFHTVALSTAQSSLKQKGRTNEARAHPRYRSLKQRGWSSVPPKVPTSEPPPG